jgi:hypothetical protein
MRRAGAAAVALLALVSGTSARAATTVSSNWAGYAVSGATFTSVSGTWTQPTADCSSSAGTQASSAFWVGLGGNSETSNALEQTGTEIDCSATGVATYSAWYELVPSASVKAPLKVAAGDRIAATVKASGTIVTVRLRNLTTGNTFTKTLRMASPDVSSAEWIAEAPSALTPGGTRILPLTDFGTVRFSSASAISTGGHTGTISDSTWSATRVDLLSGTGGQGGPGFGPFTPAYGGTQALSSVLGSGGSVFSVTWGEAG